MLLLSNTAWPRATPIVSFTCVDIDYADERPEDWRQVEDLLDGIRNCGESGGHTDIGALMHSMYTFNWRPTRSGVK